MVLKKLIKNIKKIMKINHPLSVDTWDKSDKYSPIIRSLDKNPVKVFIRYCSEVRRLFI